MGLDYADSEETQALPKKPSCDKCHAELKANNQFSVDDEKTLCGTCRQEYQNHIRKFYNS